MVDEAKLHNPVPSTFEVLVVWCAVRHCRREESGPFCSPMPTTVIAIFVHPTDLLSTLLRCNGFSGIQKAVVDQSGSRPPKSNHNLFWYKFGFGKCFGASSWSNHWAGLLLVVIHNPLFITCHNLIKKWFVDALQLLHKIREDDTSNWWLFLISAQPMRHPLSSFFTFQICFKCWRTIWCSKLSSFFDNFLGSYKRISFHNPFNLPLSTFNGWPMFSSSNFHLLCKTSWTTTALYVH